MNGPAAWLSALLVVAGCGATGGAEAGPDWPRSASLVEAPAPAGWQCTGSVRMAGAAEARLAVCRSSAPGASPELSLLWLAGDAAPRRLARLADASRAELHLYQAGSACASPDCIGSVVLLDQGDEGSCYGTEVWVRQGANAPQVAGFINEFRVEDGESRCAGASARVSAEGKGVRIDLDAPLSLMHKDGSVKALAGTGVTYAVQAGRPTLARRLR